MAGRDVALRWCASCHLVDPHAQRESNDAAPSFAAIAATKTTTRTTLLTFLAAPHGQMQDYQLSRDEIANVSAYILSLRR